MDATRKIDVRRWRSAAGFSEHADEIVVEEPLEIRVRGRPLGVTMRTPGHDEELAAGFLLSEGIIVRREDLLRVAACPDNEDGNVLDVFLAGETGLDWTRLTRHVLTSASCGLCGAATIAAVRKQFPPLQSDAAIAAETLAKLPERLQAAQPLFQRTGGLHAAAVFDLAGNLLIAHEDIGRHNAVDKVLGHGFLNRLLPFDRHVLMVSGRASFEIVQKALAARIPIMAAVSAPSSLAVELARQNGQTLVGFLRAGPDAGHMNIYANAERIQKTP